MPRPAGWTSTQPQRFWAKVHKTRTCWVWTGGRVHNGYGQMNASPDDAFPYRRVHRLSWALHFGPVPRNLCVLHRCDNRLCVRPDHLFVGTVRDNQADMVAKGRAHAVLSAYQVGELRAAYVQFVLTAAQRLGVARSTVNDILKGRIWRHVRTH